MLPDEPTDEERKEQLDQDHDTPFRPADDVPGDTPANDTYPTTDSNVDRDELYQEGVNQSTNAPQPTDRDRELEDVSEISGEDTDDESVGSPS